VVTRKSSACFTEAFIALKTRAPRPTEDPIFARTKYSLCSSGVECSTNETASLTTRYFKYCNQETASLCCRNFDGGTQKNGSFLQTVEGGTQENATLFSRTGKSGTQETAFSPPEETIAEIKKRIFLI
jgi:hypothetical protein